MPYNNNVIILVLDDGKENGAYEFEKHFKNYTKYYQQIKYICIDYLIETYENINSLDHTSGIRENWAQFMPENCSYSCGNTRQSKVKLDEMYDDNTLLFKHWHVGWLF